MINVSAIHRPFNRRNHAKTFTLIKCGWKSDADGARHAAFNQVGGGAGGDIAGHEP
jgi:hypothetical protein